MMTVEAAPRPSFCLLSRRCYPIGATSCARKAGPQDHQTSWLFDDQASATGRPTQATRSSLSLPRLARLLQPQRTPSGIVPG